VIRKCETSAKCSRSFLADQHIAQEHDGVMDRFGDEFIFRHSTDCGVDVLESNVGNGQGTEPRNEL
jgi:hypothetical protein